MIVDCFFIVLVVLGGSWLLLVVLVVLRCFAGSRQFLVVLDVVW